MQHLLEVIEHLATIDVDTMERDELAAVVRTASRVRGWLDALDVRCVRRARLLATDGRGEPAESFLGRCGNRSSKDSTATADRHTVADALPSFEQSLAVGEVSAGHLDAVAAATKHLDAQHRAEFAMHEPALLGHATHESVDAFQRRCRDLARTVTTAHGASDADELDRQRAMASLRQWVDKATGMHHLHAELDPVRAAAVDKALNRALGQRRALDGNARTPWQQLKVDSFVDAVSGGTILEGAAGGIDDPDTTACTTGVRETDTGRRRHLGLGGHGDVTAMLSQIDARIPEIAVHVDLHTLLVGAHDHGLCETDDGVPLPISTVRRLCCDAEVLPIVLDGSGIALDVGRSKRTATPAQRRALRAMHRTCGNADCTVPFSQTRAHHVQWWTRDHGPTEIDNLLPLCERCHHLVHEGGWTVTMTPDRVATWSRPDGIVHHVGSTVDRQP